MDICRVIALFVVSWSQLRLFVSVFSDVHPIQPISGACSIEIMYPGEWRVAIPASLMRVDNAASRPVFVSLQFLCLDIIKMCKVIIPFRFPPLSRTYIVMMLAQLLPALPNHFFCKCGTHLRQTEEGRRPSLSTSSSGCNEDTLEP